MRPAGISHTSREPSGGRRAAGGGRGGGWGKGGGARCPGGRLRPGQEGAGGDDAGERGEKRRGAGPRNARAEAPEGGQRRQQAVGRGGGGRRFIRRVIGEGQADAALLTEGGE